MELEEHREGLIKLYQTQLYDAGKHMTLVLNEAIRKLMNDVNPNDVEQWVVNNEKSWRKIPSKSNDPTINAIIILVCFTIIAIHLIHYRSILDHSY